MAERRMFSKRVINSARFLKMPISTQCLYFHLGLHADDDGVVEAYTVINSVGASEDDLRVLVAKGFIHVLNDDLVAYITDWTENNKIRADRKIDSIYKDLLIQIIPNIRLVQRKPRADMKKKFIECHTKAVQWTPSGRPLDGLGEDSIGKDSIGKESIDNKKAPFEIIEQEQSKKSRNNSNKKMNKQKYGIYENVLLSDKEYEKLIEEFPNDYQERIERLSEYVASTGKKYKDFLATIRSWARRERGKGSISNGISKGNIQRDGSEYAEFD